ncbi:hypothetical protein BGZ99_007762 [Dissophora globulifera]|uniref:VPS9 domain-containing protein n=1 Tax=Dissophora globulifera TaxID=979702 RepID=A0A9P6RDF3_9FUNG|nr:hypothetical protein BGZ99_007762 [Dissophora globulifera]
MQNIPGLSFFDGLTRSRGVGEGRSPSSSTASPPETPLLDASSLRSAKSSDSMSHAQVGGQDGSEQADNAFQDPLSLSIPVTSSPSSSTLPAASFSRRAATVSAGSSSFLSSISSATATSTSSHTAPPTPGLPSRRLTGSSTVGRASILSKDNNTSGNGSGGGTGALSSIFSAPILNRRPSSVAETNNNNNNSSSNSGSLGVRMGRERSASSASSVKEGEEPTAKDVALMAQGTQAYSMLKRIQEHPIELADIIRMLVTKKAILALPTCSESTEEPTLTRGTFEDHVIIPESSSGESLFVTLSGIRGVLRPTSSSITILGLATGQDFGTIASDASGPTKRSFFDNILKTDSDSTSNNTHNHDELRLVNSSKRPVVIFVESVGSIHALLVDRIIPKPEGDAIPTPLVPLATGIATIRDLSAARRTASSASSVRSMTIGDDKDLPKLPKIASEIPLEWDNVLRDLESFVVKLKRSPLNSTDKYANEFQRKYDNVRSRFEVYGSASGLKHRWSDQDFDEIQQWVEAWLCKEMYHIIFPHSGHGINSQDFLHDEQLQAKIAALNFLDLTLEHLGFVLEHPEDVDHIAQVVREGGVEMQKLASVKSPSDKMNVILSSHRVVVDALNREPAVQELLVEIEEAQEAKEAMETSDSTAATSDTNSTAEKRRSKRMSIPKILMDGVIPRVDSSRSMTGAHSPKIPMDEGYDRPSHMEDGVEADDDRDSGAATTGEKLVMESNDTEPKAAAEEESTNPKIDNTGETAANDAEAIEVSPADVELPKSPEPDEETRPSLLLVEATSNSPSPPKARAASTSSGSKRHYSADVLLPLLIFSVVKSNPPMLISTLRYIQRFKVQDQLTGELSYCLTNMMAVVSFLETLDPKALGLTSDIRVMSDLSDIQVTPIRSSSLQPTAPRLDLQERFDHTKFLGQKVSQELVGVAEEGIKVISDVVQDGYSKFLGRFLTTPDGTPAFGGGSQQNRGARGTRAMSAASSLAVTAAAEEERKRRLGATGVDAKGLTGLVSPAGVTSNVTALSVDGTAAAVEKKLDPQDTAAVLRVLEFVRSSERPQFQFMACTDSDDLRLSDVKRLLEDYQRIGKILEDMKRLA